MNILVIGVLSLLFLSCTNACQSRWNQKSSPTLTFIPARNDGSSLIRIVTNDESSTKYWTDKIETFLQPYYKSGKAETSVNLYSCDYTYKPPKNGICDFDAVRPFDVCTREFRFSYLNSRGGPCIFLKLDQFPSGWMPQFYNSSDLPEDMPQELKNAIKEEEKWKRHEKIWVSCDGENPVDKENIGPLDYYPERGFPGYYLYNRDVEGYLDPLVVISFKRPQRGVVINVLCKLWARNIPRGPETNLHFELLLDP